MTHTEPDAPTAATPTVEPKPSRATTTAAREMTTREHPSAHASGHAVRPQGTARTLTLKTRNSGFSLIELGLALAIIALIAGGVLKGRDLLANARLQNVATQLTQFEMAINSFETRYGALPGDMKNASTAFTGITASANGDGNDRIDNATEAASAFQALGLSQLINGQFDGVAPSGNSCPASTCPTTPTGGRLQFITGLAPSGTGSFRALLAPVGQLDVRQMAELDRKLDDGKPGSGRFQLLASTPADCLSGNDWNTGSALETCTGALLIQ